MVDDNKEVLLIIQAKGNMKVPLGLLNWCYCFVCF